MMDADDPFGGSDLVSSSGMTIASVKDVGPVRPRVLLPLGLLLTALVAMTLPWVVIRPLGDDRYRYNVTDIPGGIGIAWTLILVAIPGLILMGFGKRSGLVVMAMSAGVLGWMATISGLLLGVITSLLPSLDLAGLDLTKAQVGQGIGVPITVMASLVLGVLAVHQLTRDEVRRDIVRIPVLPLLLLAPLILIGVNHHVEWLSLGTDESQFRAQLPGDSLYGSGILLVMTWFAVGTWIIAIVIQKRAVMLFGSLISVVVGAVSAIYAALVWIGGNAVSWLLPDSVDKWTSVKIEPALYVTLVSGILCVAASFVGFFPQISGKVMETQATRALGDRKASWNSIAGVGLILACITVTVLRAVR